MQYSNSEENQEKQKDSSNQKDKFFFSSKIRGEKKSKRQHLSNLPEELLSQPRFFKVKEDKTPLLKAWSNTDNQKLYRNVKGLAGFDTTGHGVADDYLFLDFDHVLDDKELFVNDDAEHWYNLCAGAESYCEKSISGHGLHILMKPTKGKFGMYSGGSRGTLHFGGSAKLEIFYLTAARYCFFTGKVFDCEPKTPIVSGSVADDIFQKILDEIERRNPAKPAKKSARTTEKKFSELGNDYDSFRAGIMLDAINPAELSDSDWLAVMSACKNIGLAYNVGDCFNQRDPDRYNEKENKTRWDSLDDSSYTIETLHGIAKRFGYQEKDARHDWYQLHPEFKPSKGKEIDEKSKRELDDAITWLETLDAQTFTAHDARDSESIHKVALALKYGFLALTENFFVVIKEAKALGRNRIKESDAELTEKLTRQELNEINALVEGVNVDSLRRAIDREIKAIEKRKAELERIKKEEENERRRQERAEKTKTNSERLKELQTMPQSPERDAEMISLIRDSCDWHCNKQGVPEYVKATAANVNKIFTYDPNLDGLIGYDQFQQADVLLKPPIWNPDAKKGEEWSDRDDAQLQLYLRQTYTEFANKDLTFNAVTVYSDAHRFHVVKDFFRNLPKWDGKPRAKKLFVKFLGADDIPYVHEVTMNILTAAIARIFHPGCDYQLAPILLGEQGIGKSHCLSRLGGAWYGSLVDDVGDPHAIDAIQKLWFVEIKEMAAMKKDVDANKRFIDSAKDTHRQAYARRATTIPRHCVFVITTNNKMCLTDMTGNRRYPIIVCHNKARHYVEGLTDKYIQQVWAEVFAHYNALFKDGFDERKLELSKSSQIQSDEIAEEYLRDDGMESEIRAYLETKIPPITLWHLLTREERRKFIADGRLVILDALTEFNHRRRARGGKEATVQRDVNLISSCLSPAQNKHWLRIEHKTIQGNDVDEFILYGSELRQHICATEIYNECFGNDRRKSPTRIHEVLNNLDDWSLGARIQKSDPAYLDQKKVFYRNDDY